MQLHCTTLLAFKYAENLAPAYPQMIYSYVKNTRSLRLMFAMIYSVIFGNYDIPENLHIIIIIIIIITSSDDIQPSTLLSNQSPSGLIL